MAFPYLKYLTSRCCHGLPYFKPVEDNDANAHVHDEEDNNLLPAGASGGTYTVNGKEYKKRSKKVKKSALSEEATKSDPLAQLGFGIVAYTGMLYYMIWAFFLYTLLLIPTFYFYAGGDAYAGTEDASKLGYAPRTIGALGYSSYQCQSIPVALSKFNLYCDYGQIGSVDFYGVNPDAAHGACMANTDNALCATNNPALAIQLAAVVGKTSGTVDITDSDLWTTTVDASCTTADAFFYAQFTCIMSESQQHQKYN